MCMFTATAVAGATEANRRWSFTTSSMPSPSPPSSRGTATVRYPEARSSSKSSWKKRFSRSYIGARSSKRASISSVSTFSMLLVATAVAVMAWPPRGVGCLIARYGRTPAASAADPSVERGHPAERVEAAGDGRQPVPLGQDPRREAALVRHVDVVPRQAERGPVHERVRLPDPGPETTVEVEGRGEPSFGVVEPTVEPGQEPEVPVDRTEVPDQVPGHRTAARPRLEQSLHLAAGLRGPEVERSEEHTSELQSPMYLV